MVLLQGEKMVRMMKEGGREVFGPLNAFDLCTEPSLKAPHDRQ